MPAAVHLSLPNLGGAGHAPVKLEKNKVKTFKYLDISISNCKFIIKYYIEDKFRIWKFNILINLFIQYLIFQLYSLINLCNSS